MEPYHYPNMVSFIKVKFIVNKIILFALNTK